MSVDCHCDVREGTAVRGEAGDVGVPMAGGQRFGVAPMVVPVEPRMGANLVQESSQRATVTVSRSERVGVPEPFWCGLPGGVTDQVAIVVDSPCAS